MAFTLEKQTLVDGHNLLVVKVTFSSDAAADVTKGVLIDVSDYSPDPSTSLRLMEVMGAVQGFFVTLFWDGTGDAQIITIPDANPIHECYEKFGGIQNNTVSGGNGDILYSTSGAASADTGHLIFCFRKQ